MLKWITGIVALCNPLKGRAPRSGGPLTGNHTACEGTLRELSLKLAKVQAKNDAGERENAMLKANLDAVKSELRMERERNCLSSQYCQRPPMQEMLQPADALQGLGAGLSGLAQAFGGQFAQSQALRGKRSRRNFQF